MDGEESDLAELLEEARAAADEVEALRLAREAAIEEALANGPVHWTKLRAIGMSAAHYEAAIREELRDTRAMLIGRLVHTLVLGGPPSVVWNKARQGKAWKQFKEENRGREIVTASELAVATKIARAVQGSEIAAPYLVGDTEVPLEWTNGMGIKCATRGVDIIGADFFGDLKTTKCAEPGRFNRDARSRCYHAQMANNREGLRLAKNLDFDSAILIAVETAAPYCVTVVRIGPKALDIGDRINRLWYERLKSCREAGVWPGYTQSVVDFELPRVDPEIIVGGEVFDWGGDDEEDDAAA